MLSIIRIALTILGHSIIVMISELAKKTLDSWSAQMRPLRTRPSLRGAIAFAEMDKLHTGTEFEKNEALRNLARTNSIPDGVNLSNLKVDARTSRALSGVNMRRAKLNNTIFKGPLNYTNLQESHGVGLKLEGDNRGVNMDGSVHYNMEAHSLNDFSAKNAAFLWANFKNASMNNTDMRNTIIGHSVMDGVVGSGLKLDNAELAHTSMQDARLENASLITASAPKQTNRTTFAGRSRLSAGFAAMAAETHATMTGDYEIEDKKVTPDMKLVTAERVIAYAARRKPGLMPRLAV